VAATGFTAERSSCSKHGDDTLPVRRTGGECSRRLAERLGMGTGMRERFGLAQTAVRVR
jgi:hypothetical protein